MSDYISKSALIEDIKRRPYIDKALEEIFFTIIDEQPTISETEIIRKAFERVVENEHDIKAWNTRKPMERIVAIVEDYMEDAEHYGFASAISDMVEAIKEEGGIE